MRVYVEPYGNKAVDLFFFVDAAFAKAAFYNDSLL